MFGFNRQYDQPQQPAGFMPQASASYNFVERVLSAEMSLAQNASMPQMYFSALGALETFRIQNSRW